MIGRETIDRIRARVSLVAVVGETVKLQRRGRSYVGLCPFHQEKSPSFTVSDERGLFHCFGCKASGDVFKFVELTEGSSFMDALKKLADRAGVELEDDRDDADRAQEQRQKKLKDDLVAVNAFAAGYFERMLHEHPLGAMARAELERRGLGFEGRSGEVLRAFRVGYAPHGWDGLTTYFRQNGVSPALAEQVGLLAPRSGGSGFYDAFRHRLMVAVLDVSGRVVAFSGRVLPSPPGEREDPSRGAPPKYVNSRESTIYAKGHTLFGLHQARAGIRTRGEAVIVEGNFDLIAMHARGIDHVVAPMGTAFTPDQARLLRRFTSTLTLLFDADAAGRKATWAARATCREAGLAAKVARLSEGKDPDEFLRARGPEPMLDALRAARSLDEALIDDVLATVGEGVDLSAKRTALDTLRPLLEEQEITLRNVLATRVAQKLGLDLPTFWRVVRGAGPSNVGPSGGGGGDRGGERGGPNSVQKLNGPSRSSREGLDGREGRDAASGSGAEEELSRAIVTALFAAPELIESPPLQPSLSLVAGDWALAVLELREEMRKSRRENRPIDGSALLARLPESIQKFAAATLVAPSLGPVDAGAATGGPTEGGEGGDAMGPGASGGGGSDDASRRARTLIRQNGAKLAKTVSAERLRELDRDIGRADEAGDFARATALLAEKQRLSAAVRTAQAEAHAAADDD
jgi:DNA primase